MKKQSIKKMLMLGLAGISLVTVGTVASQAPTVSASTVTTTKKATSKKAVQRRNALKMANEYANVNHLSMVDTYTATKAYYSKYPTAVIKYAINHVKANWNKNALYAAKKYKKIVKMTNKQIYNQLISRHGDRFTKAQAKYAISHL